MDKIKIENSNKIDLNDFYSINDRRLLVNNIIKRVDIEKKGQFLYIYTKKTDFDTKNGIVKIGETGSATGYRSVLERLYEQTNSTDTEPLLLLYILDCEKYIKSGILKNSKDLEKSIHRMFDSVSHKDGAGTEWFAVDIRRVLEYIKIKVKDTPIVLDDFKPHFLQELAICIIMDFIRNDDNNDIIAELCARFGKTLMYLEIFKRLDSDIMILPAYMHSVFTSFEEEIIGRYKDENIGKWLNFKGFKIIDTRVDNWQKKFSDNLGSSKMVLFVSVQTREVSLIEFNILKNVESDRKFIVIDEADFGAHTESSQKVIDYII